MVHNTYNMFRLWLLSSQESAPDSARYDADIQRKKAEFARQKRVDVSNSKNTPTSEQLDTLSLKESKSEEEQNNEPPKKAYQSEKLKYVSIRTSLSIFLYNYLTFSGTMMRFKRGE